MNNFLRALEPHRAYYRVYIEDTDTMGIVYHARYLHFLERARTDLLRDNGFYLTMMSKYDTHFAIRDVQIRYVYPAKLDDMLCIQTCVDRVKAYSLRFKQTMYNQADERLCDASIEVVCVDKNLKPKKLEEYKNG